jgi:ABC-type uncharacterized transport system permease subunit
MHRWARDEALRKAGIGIGFLALAIHAIPLVQGLHTPQGINLSVFNALSASAWLIVAILLGASVRKPVENLGIVLMPLAALMLLLKVHYPAAPLVPMQADWDLRLHVLISLLAYSLLMIASVQALVLALQDKLLKRHRFGALLRALPPLQTMESLLFQWIWAGFILLTGALISGLLYLEDMFAQHVAHKTVLSILAWVLFAVLLLGRHYYGWRGRTAIRWTLAGFILLAFAFIGSKIVLELILPGRV